MLSTRSWKRIFYGLLVVIGLAIGGVVVWLQIPIGTVLPAAEAAMQSDEQVSVTRRGWLAFIPNDDLPNTGYIFYPGAKVTPEAYAPMARRLAEAGYLVVLTQPPFNISLFDNNAATTIMDSYSAVETWVVGGHSLGGTSASIYADSHPQQVAGLVLLAARPWGDGLADDDLPVISLYGTNDGIATVDEQLASRPNLPPDAQFIPIEGGNHSQFGYYGLQSGDTPATISREEQLAQVIDATLDLLDRVSEADG